MSLEISQCRKHVFPVDPEGIFPRTKDRLVQAALPSTYHSSNKLLCTVGVKYDKKFNLEEPHFLV